MSSNVVIEVKNVSKTYKIFESSLNRFKNLFCSNPKYYTEFKALTDVSFEVLEGETIGIIGKNGSGKSTLLQILCRTLSKTSGTINIKGRVAALLELGAGFNPEFTGKENVYLNGLLMGLTTQEIDSKYNSIVEFSEIGIFINQPVKTYSSGMYVRLAFSIIAHLNADILIIDEALAVGDAMFTQKCMRFLREFRKKGTILFVSHDTSAVAALCNRVVWLDKGVVTAVGDVKEVTEMYLETCYDNFNQPKNEIIENRSNFKPQVISDYDQRLNFINNSNLRNDLQIFAFDESAKSFGNGEGKIIGAWLSDSLGRNLTWVVGTEIVVLRIAAVAINDIQNPIVGFYIKDKSGQTLFGDNTYLSYCDKHINIPANSNFKTEFKFQMPILPIGDYSIAVALASGSQEDHKQLHWIHDALIFKSITTSCSTGLVGVIMQEIIIEFNDEKI